MKRGWAAVVGSVFFFLSFGIGCSSAPSLADSDCDEATIAVERYFEAWYTRGDADGAEEESRRVRRVLSTSWGSEVDDLMQRVTTARQGSSDELSAKARDSYRSLNSKFKSACGNQIDVSEVVVGFEPDVIAGVLGVSVNEIGSSKNIDEPTISQDAVVVEIASCGFTDLGIVSSKDGKVLFAFDNTGTPDTYDVVVYEPTDRSFFSNSPEVLLYKSVASRELVEASVELEPGKYLIDCRRYDPSSVSLFGLGFGSTVTVEAG